MTQVLIAIAVFVAALAVGAVLRGRRAVDPPTQPIFSAPAQVDRADFADVSAPWLVAVFSSASCSTCADVLAKAKVLSCADRRRRRDITEPPQRSIRHAVQLRHRDRRGVKPASGPLRADCGPRRRSSQPVIAERTSAHLRSGTYDEGQLASLRGESSAGLVGGETTASSALPEVSCTMRRLDASRFELE